MMQRMMQAPCPSVRNACRDCRRSVSYRVCGIDAVTWPGATCSVSPRRLLFRFARSSQLVAQHVGPRASTRAPHRLLAVFALLATVVVGACSDDDPFRSPATASNLITGVSLAVFSNGATAPAGLDLLGFRAVRPEIGINGTPNFQLAIDIDASGTLRLHPVLTLLNPPGGATTVGLQSIGSSFAELARAPTDGFVDDSAQVIAVGETYLFRFSAGTCVFGDPLYGKLELIAYDAVSRRATIRYLLNRNCGYRDLTEGLPVN